MAVNLDKLIELAYSAAVEDDRWADWTEELVDQFGSPGALFWVIDSDRFDMCQSRMLFRDADNKAVNEEYLSGPVHDDPQMHRVCDVKQSEIYLDTDHVDLDDPRTVEYLNWQESVVGTRHHITLSVVLRPGLEAGVSMHRSAAQGPASCEIVQQLKTVFPHISRALRLGFQHTAALQESWWDGLSNKDRAARVLIDRHGLVLRASPAAETVFRRQDGLSIASNRLSCSSPDCSTALAALIDRACRDEGASAGGLSICRSSGRTPYLVSAYPLVQRQLFLAPFGAAALVCIKDPDTPTRKLPMHVCEMIGFTPKEAEVANLFMLGHSIASLSSVMEISPNTTRVHLQSMMRKTSTSRQSDLILFLTGLV